MVHIIGYGCTPVKEHWDKGIRELAFEAALKALEKAGIDKVDALVVGNMSSGVLAGQEHLGALIADELGMSGISALKVEAACASGGAAVHSAYAMVKSGAYKRVLVVGVEKMTDKLTPQVTSALAMAEDQRFTVSPTGVSFVALNALLHRLYMERYGVKPEEVAAFAVNDHKHAVNSPHAQYRNEITVEQVMKSPMVADPIHLLESSPIGDGAAAVVLSSEPEGDSSVEIAASVAATDVFCLFSREDMLSLRATVLAAKKAYEQAKISPEDVDVLEVHDAFSILGAIALEDLGFAERGQGAKMAYEGETLIGGKLPTNTFGGLKARGHPVGATGVYQIVELCMQLSNEAGKNQVPDANVGLAQNVGGVGGTVVIHVLRGV